MPEVSRRTVTKGAAWAAPVLVSASPAPVAAASDDPNVPRKALWSQRASTTSTVATGGVTARAARLWPTMISGDNLATIPLVNPDDNATYDWLRLATVGDNRSGQTLTVTFPQPIYCASFVVTDIDSGNSGQPISSFRDYVAVPGFTTTATTAPADYVHRVSTSEVRAARAPSRSTYDWAPEDVRGQATFTAAGPVTTFTITVRNPNARVGATGPDNNYQDVYVSPITYKLTPGC